MLNPAGSGMRRTPELIVDYKRHAEALNNVLRRFERIAPEPEETRTVCFEPTPWHLEIPDHNMRWTVEPGEFEHLIGASGEDIRLKSTFRVL